MADNFTVQTQYPGLLALGGTQTQDVVFVGISTIPHGTYLEFPLDAKIYSSKLVKSEGTGWATIVELVWDEPNVVGVQWAQSVNKSNQLQQELIVTVQSSSGNSAAQLTVPYSQLAPDRYKPMIEHLHAELDAGEKA